MKITVMGTSGRIGTRLVEKLRQTHAEVITASPSLGVRDGGKGLFQPGTLRSKSVAPSNSASTKSLVCI